MDVNTESTYIGAGLPYDVSAIAAQGAACWKHSDDDSHAFWLDADGTLHDVTDSATALNSVTEDTVAWKIQDESHLDTGWIPQVVVTQWIYWPPGGAVYAPSSCRNNEFSIKYYYDHNQGSGNVTTIGVSIGALTVGYSGGSPLELQQTTGLMHSSPQPGE